LGLTGDVVHSTGTTTTGGQAVSLGYDMSFDTQFGGIEPEFVS